MAKTSAIITSTDLSGKTLQKTLTNVNPEATSEHLATLGQMLNSLTTNTYVQTDRIDKINCDTEASPVDTRSANAITLSQTSMALPGLIGDGHSSYITFTATANADKAYLSYVAPGVLAGISKMANNTYAITIGDARGTHDQWQVIFTESAVAVKIAIPGDETYKDAEAEFTVTVS